jgi:colicin import membrane protein
MRANSPSSLFASLGLHAFVVAIILCSTLYLARQDRDQPVIFELVAGPATAPDELVAPALGNTTAALPVPKTEPTIAKPEPVVQTQPEPVVQTQPEEKAVEPPVEKVRPKAPEKTKSDTSILKEMKQAQRMSYKDYLKKHPTPKVVASNQPRQSANGPRVDATGIAQGVRGGSTANTRGGGGGNALSREQQNQLDTYISLLIQELKKAHEPPPGVSDRLETKVTFDITASGAILNPRISKSSGDKAFDESVLEAFLRVRSIGPTPDHRSATWSVTFKMRDDS